MPPSAIDAKSFKPLIVRALVMPVFLLAVFAAIMLWQVTGLISAQGWVAHTDQVIGQANELRFLYR